MTEREDEIRERLEAATEGPWRWRNTQDVYLFGARSRVVMAFARQGMQGAQPQFRGADNLLYDAGKENLYGFPDAEFIAHAREDVPWLLAEVERLREDRDQYSRCSRLLTDEVCRLTDEVATLRDEVERLRLYPLTKWTVEKAERMADEMGASPDSLFVAWVNARKEAATLREAVREVVALRDAWANGPAVGYDRNEQIELDTEKTNARSLTAALGDAPEGDGET